MDVVTLIAIVLLAYLLGSIPSSVWMGKLFFGKDVREHGSGNPGATNTARILGWKAGIIVLLFDVFKGWASAQLVFLAPHGALHDDQSVYFKVILAAAAVAGHIFSVFLRFKGGKGVATIFGAIIALYGIKVLILVGIFMLVLLTTGFVSVASVLTSVSFPFVEWLIFSQDSAALIGFAVLVAIVVPLTHRKNMGRLLKGEESRFFSWRRKKNDRQV